MKLLVLCAVIAFLWTVNAAVEVATVLPGRGKMLMTVSDEAKTLLAETIPAQLKNKQAVAIPECSLKIQIKIDSTVYALCGKTLIKGHEAFPVDSGLLIDIIFAGKNKIPPLDEKNKVLALAEVPEIEGEEEPVMAFREIPGVPLKSSPRDNALHPRFVDESLKVSPAVYVGAADPEFPGNLNNVDRAIVNTAGYSYNCYGYATRSRRWGAPGCYTNGGPGVPTAPIPANWGTGWCKPRAGNGATGLNTNPNDNPCTALLAAHVADGLTTADPGNGIKVAIFAHMFVAAVPAGAPVGGGWTLAHQAGGFDYHCSMDYHYHRQDSNGKWSDKNGDTDVMPQFTDPVIEDRRRMRAGQVAIRTGVSGGAGGVDLYRTRFCGYRWSTDRSLEPKTFNVVANSYC